MKTNHFKKIAIGLLMAFSLNANADDISDVEHFPMDYFLVHKNMPHYMKLFRQFGDDKTLALSDEQKNRFQGLQESVSTVSQIASQIRGLELKLQKDVVLEKKNSKQTKDLVEKIAKLRAQLTMMHIDCIYNSKQILTPEQDKFFIQKSGIEK